MPHCLNPFSDLVLLLQLLIQHKLQVLLRFEKTFLTRHEAWARHKRWNILHKLHEKLSRHTMVKNGLPFLLKLLANPRTGHEVMLNRVTQSTSQ